MDPTRRSAPRWTGAQGWRGFHLGVGFRPTAASSARLIVQVYLAGAKGNTLILSPRPVLNRLRQVRGLDGVAAGQIGDGARQLERPVKGVAGWRARYASEVSSSHG